MVKEAEILYINAASVMAHTAEIEELITRRKPMILAASESCLTEEINDTEIAVNGYRIA